MTAVMGTSRGASQASPHIKKYQSKTKKDKEIYKIITPKIKIIFLKRFLFLCPEYKST
jgi:hypothetical protein